MRIAIIGAGIVGVTTAYELAAQGHEVEVFERRASVAEGTSFANAGVLSPGYVTPWAAPGMPSKVLRYLFENHAPVRLSLPLTAEHMRWSMQWLKACKPAVYQENRQRLQTLATYSLERLQTLTKQLHLEYDKSQGYLVLLRTEPEFERAQTNLAVLREAGFTHKIVDAATARRIEPALNANTKLHAAIHMPDDWVANCRQFAMLLRDQAVALGAKFHFGQTIQNIHGTTLQINNSERESKTFDHVVVCAGVDSPSLLKAIGVNVPLIPVYGYSVSAAIREPFDAPQSGVMDERYKVAISRIGNRVRVAGSAEIGGHADRINAGAIKTLYKVLNDWFPAAAQVQGKVQNSNQIQTWKGARPMLPSKSPLLGESAVKNVWLNLGHGSSGWALACGSALVISDLIAGRKPKINI